MEVSDTAVEIMPVGNSSNFIGQCDKPWIANVTFASGLNRLDVIFLQFVARIMKDSSGRVNASNCEIVEQFQDYVSALKTQEEKRITYKGSITKRKKTRSDAISLMMEIVTKENLSNATLFLAAYIYDRVGSTHRIEKCVSGLVATVAISIAAKLEEQKSNVPNFQKLLSHIPESQESCRAAALKLEGHILVFFRWSFMIPSAYTFLELFALFILDPGEELGYHSACKRVARNFPPLPDARFSARNVETLQNFALDTLHSLLLEEPNDEFPPSLVAASILLFSRMAHGFYDWTRRLQFITGYSIIQALECLEKYLCPILKIRRRSSPRPCFNS